MATTPLFFDYANEIANRLETSAAFGCSKEDWYFLVQAAQSCQLFSGVDPVLLCRLPGARAGAVLLLYGKIHEYEIRLEVESGELLLNQSPLDVPSLMETVFRGSVRSFDDWRQLTTQIILTEGYTGVEIDWETGYIKPGTERRVEHRGSN